MPGGRASPSMAATAICSRTTPIWRAGNPGCGPLPATILPNTGISAAASIARRHSRATVSRPACSSVPGTTPATGAWSENLFAADALSDDQRRMLLSGKSADGLASRRSDRLRLLRRRPQHDLRRDCGGRCNGGRNRRATEGRDQLRLVHSGIEAADRAGKRRRCRNALSWQQPTKPSPHRHCEERERRSNPALRQAGLLREACHRARVRAALWLAMTRRDDVICRLAKALRGNRETAEIRQRRPASARHRAGHLVHRSRRSPERGCGACAAASISA